MIMIKNSRIGDKNKKLFADGDGVDEVDEVVADIGRFISEAPQS